MEWCSMTTKRTGTIEAILAINPHAAIIVHTPAEGEETIDWGGTPEISQSDIDAKKVELEEEWTAQEYARKRQDEYPSIRELVVGLYDESDKEALVAKRAAVKLKYPKP